MARKKPSFSVIMRTKHMSSVTEKWACGYLRLSGWVFYLWHEYDNSFKVAGECTNDFICLFNVDKERKKYFFDIICF